MKFCLRFVERMNPWPHSVLTMPKGKDKRLQDDLLYEEPEVFMYNLAKPVEKRPPKVKGEHLQDDPDMPVLPEATHNAIDPLTAGERFLKGEATVWPLTLQGAEHDLTRAEARRLQSLADKTGKKEELKEEVMSMTAPHVPPI